jgi:hypothetical protein
MTLEIPESKLGGELFRNERLRCRISWYCNLAVPNPQPGKPKRQRLEGIAVVGLDASNNIVGARMTSISLSRPDVLAKHVAWRTLPRAV